MTNPAEDITYPPSSFEYLWNVPVALAVTTDDGTTHVNKWVSGETEEVSIPGNAKLVVVNNQYNSFLRVLYRGEMLEDFSNALNADIENVHHLSRANFVSDMFAFAENTPLTEVTKAFKQGIPEKFWEFYNREKFIFTGDY